MAHRGNASGFVLVMTLWALAALGLLATYINHVVATDVDRAIEEKGVFQAELDRRNTEATLIYLLATGRMNHHALILEEEQDFSAPQRGQASSPFNVRGELHVTGNTYAGIGGTRFSVQDEGGLISVNAPRFPPFAALLERMGLAEEDARQVIARVDDYIDANDTLNLGGAERQDYQRQSKAPPLNWIMSSPKELSDVLGVENLIPRESWSQLRSVLTMRPVSNYNFNTMHPKILAALLELDEYGVRGVLEEREKGPLSRQTQLAMLSGKHLDIDEMEVAVLPSNFLKLAVWHETVGPRSVVGIELTPLGDVAPWRKDYRYTEAASQREDSGISSDPPLEAATPLLR